MLWLYGAPKPRLEDAAYVGLTVGMFVFGVLGRVLLNKNLGCPLAGCEEFKLLGLYSLYNIGLT